MCGIGGRVPLGGVVWSRTRNLDRIGATDFVGGVSAAGCSGGVVRLAVGSWRNTVVWYLSGSCLEVVGCWIGGNGLSGGCLAVAWKLSGPEWEI